VDAIESRDMNRAKEKLYALTPAAAKMGGLLDRTIKLKQALAEKAYTANSDACQEIRLLIIANCLVSPGLGFLLTFSITKGFSVPLGQAVRALEQLADGDLTASFHVDIRDEVGRMAEARNNALEKLNAV
jgi:methyl-accepting chemotaxis protein